MAPSLLIFIRQPHDQILLRAFLPLQPRVSFLSLSTSFSLIPEARVLQMFFHSHFLRRTALHSNAKRFVAPIVYLAQRETMESPDAIVKPFLTMGRVLVRQARRRSNLAWQAI